jgi:hypothetical protein
MTWAIVLFVLALAALGPFFGADSREHTVDRSGALWRQKER